MVQEGRTYRERTSSTSWDMSSSSHVIARTLSCLRSSSSITRFSSFLSAMRCVICIGLKNNENTSRRVHAPSRAASNGAQRSCTYVFFFFFSIRFSTTKTLHCYVKQNCWGTVGQRMRCQIQCWSFRFMTKTNRRLAQWRQQMSVTSKRSTIKTRHRRGGHQNEPRREGGPSRPASSPSFPPR